ALQPSNLEGTLSHQTASPGPPLMTSIGLSRKESSTAFLSHWFTCQVPSLPRSATRASPRSRRSSAVSTASRISPRVPELIPSRCSKASSTDHSSAPISGLVMENIPLHKLLRASHYDLQHERRASRRETYAKRLVGSIRGRVTGRREMPGDRAK